MTIYGVYWEYIHKTEPNTLACYLYVPEYHRRHEENAVGATLLYRTVSEENPRRTYRTHQAPPHNVHLLGVMGDPAALAIQCAPQLDIFTHAAITAVDGNPDYAIKNPPIYLEITDLELDNIRVSVTPRSMLSRLYRSRSSAGYPELPGRES